MVVKNGIVSGKAFEGYQDLETKRPVDEQTIYHWASITKMLTGVAIVQLRDRGLLALDDPAITDVPEQRGVRNPFGDMSQVTIRHQMTHSGGFRAPTWPWGSDRRWHPFEPTRWEQLVAMFPYTDYVVAFNTNAWLKADARRTTRAVDAALRELIIEEIFTQR